MKTKLKNITATILCVLSACIAQANDGVYFVNGNQLVPIHETDIEVAKEVLTISLCDDGYANVDVKYEFINKGKAKTIDMGFEAMAPYNDEAKVNKEGKHPYITNFTAMLNGVSMEYKNALVIAKIDEECDFVPVDNKRYRIPKDDEWENSNCLYDTKNNEVVPFAYAYYFSAHFKEGKNTIHHTYRYRMSYGVGRTFEVSYWLKPAMRWANKQIDDFTLRIKAEGTAKHFCIADSLFLSSSFKLVEGNGKIRKNDFGWETNYIEIALRDGTVEWNSLNFKPLDDLDIVSADCFTSYDERYPLGYFYDRNKTYNPNWPERKADKRILRNLPYANRGYVFKDKSLSDYFNRLWWYMPDPQWKASTSDFTPRELELIKNNRQ